MRKSILLASAIIAIGMVSCDGSKKKLEQTDAELTQTKSELQSTLETQDSLLALINDITSDMTQIKELESIVASPANLSGESASRKTQIKNDILSIRETLTQRRERLAQLESKLSKLQGEKSTALKTIESLKTQIAQQEESIANLTNELAAAKIHIGELTTAVDSLNTAVTLETAGREQAEQNAMQLDNELNTVYYALGSKSELEKANIIKTGFLRKTKIMQGDYEMSYFTRADRRNFNNLDTHSNKAKIVTPQPQDSYRFDTNADGNKVLVITNPTRFWNAGNFLVIQTN